MSDVRYLSPCCGSDFNAIVLGCQGCRHQFTEPIKAHDTKEKLMEKYGMCIVDAEGQHYVELCPICLSPRFTENLCRCDKCGVVFQAEEILKEYLEDALPW